MRQLDPSGNAIMSPADRQRAEGGRLKLMLSRATRASASRRSAMARASDGISASGRPRSVTASAASPGRVASATRSS
jgi:hypothetical protein